MKKIFVVVLIFLSAFSSNSQSVGIGTTTPDPSSILDIYDNARGVLLPRVALVSTTSASPVTNPATGLLVYNTATSGTSPINVIPGYYYWNGSKWYPVVNKGTNFGDMQYWDGTQWINIPIGPNGSVLTVCNGVPKWGPCETTLTISPANNPYEGLLGNFFSNVFVSPHPQIIAEGWTNGGNPHDVRTMIKFDLTGIPNGAIIDSAKLYLYADLNPINGNQIDAMFGPTNSYYIQRVTSNWTLPTPFTWNNPPATTTVNQVTVPQSTSSFENTVADVKLLINDILQSGNNNGFLLKLVNEVTYNSRQYYSSTNSDPNKRPKLVIKYH